eukprot:CAMPEP_0173180604 /NCGR_PEP_ID=MMETSP1141-20130122/6807_1 /TAXON_ID=483371 /ORGANISM="non described non described, Strain CCMP2298" /LENGTH=667 /DNA_ID=CAMNT_0014103471 /DNA_START=44 /DNA_END=2048 /DNA_ORIENTATION=+
MSVSPHGLQRQFTSEPRAGVRSKACEVETQEAGDKEEDKGVDLDLLERQDAFDGTIELGSTFTPTPTATPMPLDRTSHVSFVSGTSDGTSDNDDQTIDPHPLRSDSDSDTASQDTGYSENLDTTYRDLGLPSQIECFPTPLGPQTDNNKNPILDKTHFCTYSEGVRHNAWVCEHPGCLEAFYCGGRHHCRICGASVCTLHCGEKVRLPTALLEPVPANAPNSSHTRVLATALFGRLPQSLEFSRACLLCCSHSISRGRRAEQQLKARREASMERALGQVRGELLECHREIQLLAPVKGGVGAAMDALSGLETRLCGLLLERSSREDGDGDGASEQPLWGRDSPLKRGVDEQVWMQSSGKFDGKFGDEFGDELVDEEFNAVADGPGHVEEEEKEGVIQGAQEVQWAGMLSSEDTVLSPRPATSTSPTSALLARNASDVSLGSDACVSGSLDSASSRHSLRAALDRALSRNSLSKSKDSKHDWSTSDRNTSCEVLLSRVYGGGGDGDGDRDENLSPSLLYNHTHMFKSTLSSTSNQQNSQTGRDESLPLQYDTFNSTLTSEANPQNPQGNQPGNQGSAESAGCLGSLGRQESPGSQESQEIQGSPGILGLAGISGMGPTLNPLSLSKPPRGRRLSAFFPETQLQVQPETQVQVQVQVEVEYSSPTGKEG